MMKLQAKTRLKASGEVTYAQYRLALASMAQPEGTVQALGVPPALASFVAHLKSELTALGESVGVGLRDLVKALMNRDAFALLKAIRFNIGILVKGAHQLLKLVPQGLLALFKELHQSAIFKKAAEHVDAIDALLDKYPIIKKLTGPALAALLFWMWLNSTFTGHPTTDLGVGHVVAALAGKFTLHDLFMTPEAWVNLALFFAGPVVSGPTALNNAVSWLGNAEFNVILALIFTTSYKFAPRLSRAIKTKLFHNQ